MIQCDEFENIFGKVFFVYIDSWQELKMKGKLITTKETQKINDERTLTNSKIFEFLL